MDAFLCKGVVNPIQKNKECKEQGQLENEPPLKKLKQDNGESVKESYEIVIIEKPATKNNEMANTGNGSIVTEQSDGNAIEGTKDLGNASSDVVQSDDTTPEKKDDISPPKQKRRKLSNEEKEAQLKQKEEARILREKLMMEKQLEKEKKEKEREELRVKREKEKQEKQAKKEQLEKERLEKQKKKEELMLAKEEEKKKREEERKQKDEERKQKEEERKKQDEEKKLKDEEEIRKKEREKSAFRSFFIKKSPPKKIATIGEQSDLFAPFEIKPNMTLAPLCRGKQVEDKGRFDQQFERQEIADLYLSRLRTRCSKEGIKFTTGRKLKTKTKLIESSNTDLANDIIVVSSTGSPSKEQPKHEIMRVKLLQFSENHRPAYYGTWRKRSKIVSPKNPYKKDEDQLNYEVDSDEEWEEEEPGESLSGPENEDEEEEEGEGDDDDDDDGFFVPHGYLSDDEGIEGEGESDGEKEEQVDIKDRKLDKTEGFPFDKKVKAKQHKATCFGSTWFSHPKDVPDFLVGYKICPMVKLPLDLFEIRQNELSERKSPPAAEPAANIYRGCVPLRVPEEAMHLLINHVHKNSFGLARLIKTFLEFWNSRQPAKDETSATAYPQISKRQLERKIVEIAKRDTLPDSNKSCYLVHQDILDKYATQLETCIDVKATILEIQKTASLKSPPRASKQPAVSCNGISPHAENQQNILDDQPSTLNNEVKSRNDSALQTSDQLPKITETSLKKEIVII